MQVEPSDNPLGLIVELPYPSEVPNFETVWQLYNEGWGHYMSIKRAIDSKTFGQYTLEEPNRSGQSKRQLWKSHRQLIGLIMVEMEKVAALLTVDYFEWHS